MEIEEQIYPRQLSDREKGWLFYLLPEDKPVYASYRDKINDMQIIGEGRFGSGNYVLGYEGDELDLSYSSLPMFASGQIVCKEGTIQISIHEFYDNKIEVSINNLSGDKIPENLTEIKRWSYSYWKPGEISPFENDKPREVNLLAEKGKAVLAISNTGGSVWLYDKENQINHIIPVTNFINELLRGNTKIDRTKGININYVFENINMFKNEEIVKAFIQYNKQYRKIDLPETELTKTKKKGIMGKLFGN